MKIIVPVLITLLLVASIIVLYPNDKGIYFFAYATGEAIRNMRVEQYNGTHWEEICNITSSGGLYRVYQNYIINFTVQVLLDYTYASSASQAIANTNITMAIKYNSNTTYVTGWQEVELTNATNAVAYDSNTYWLVTKCGNWTSNLPSSGNTYRVTANYQANY